MNDPLRQLLDRPPRDADPDPSPAFTAAVMARLPAAPAALPAAGPSPSAWWLGAAVAAAAALFLPLDPVVDPRQWSGVLDRDLLIELAIGSLLAAGALVVALSPRRMRS